ncbi:hypothetical protein [Hyalangium minutum]|uniref:Putative lipoprotein n=1 Tax=Hyalangium minutum TaxID=394096 RepID=A0A085VZH6_9BACT|nr:hypothetical protein [Hyalangium minutum]KFE60839.1 putative lipoprotein [Hyalangium minutum]
MLKTCRFLLLLGVLWGLTGCPDTPCFDGGVGVFPGAQPGVILVGEPARLEVAPSAVSACGQQFDTTPESLTVEVYGPDNQPVASQATLGNPTSALAIVKFTPDKPGRYHVFAAFDPVGGIQQMDLYAARNRSAEAPLFNLPSLCTSLERTQRGGWLCDLQFLRDGKLVKGFTSGRLAVAGDVVWVASSAQVQRYVDTGTELLLTASRSTNVSSAEFLLATENELLMLSSSALDRFVYDGTQTLSFPSSVQVPVTSERVGTTGLSGLLVRSGDRLGLVTHAPPSGGVQPFNSFTTQVCSYRLEGERIVRTADPCQTFTGKVVGYEPGVLWVGTPLSFGEQFSDLRRLEWTAAGIAEQASLPLGQNFQLSPQPFSPRNWVVPVVMSPVSTVGFANRVTVAVYSPERRSILLEMLDTELTNPSASGSLLWTGPSSGPLTPRVRVRPTTP